MKKEKIRMFWADFYRDFKAVAPMLISHHPPCETYKNHTINIGRIKLCIGCFIGYPSAILTIIITKILYDRNSFNLIPILIFGIIFSLAQLFFISISILVIPIGYLHYLTSSKTCENCEIKKIPGKCPVD